jgi:CheY-like chemotaxis protein
MTCRVVVADNDRDALDLVVLDLSLEGHTIVGTASGGTDAVALCQAMRPDVLVVDYRMPPGPNGIDVARAVRDLPGLRVVLYSNYTGAGLREQAAKAGATYLQKGQLAALRRALRAA